MKKFFALLLTLAMVLSFASVAAVAEETDGSLTPVPQEAIPDEVLYQVILDQVNANRQMENQETVDTLYYEDLDTVEGIFFIPFFSVYEGQIQDLTGIELCENLSTVMLYNCPLDSLQPLYELQNLVVLSANNCGITSLEDLLPLKDQLEMLDLSNNQFQDLSQITSFTNLQILGLAGNQIDSLDIFVQLENLVELDVSQNNIADFSVLKDFPSLAAVTISNNLVDMKNADTIALLKELEDNGMLILNSSQLPKDGHHYDGPVTIYHQWNGEEDIGGDIGIPGLGDLDLNQLLVQKLNGEIIENQEFYTIEEPGEYEYTASVNVNAIINLIKQTVKAIINEMVASGENIKEMIPGLNFEGEVPTDEEIDAFIDEMMNESNIEKLLETMMQGLPELNYSATFTIKAKEPTPTPGGDEKPDDQNTSSKPDDAHKPANTADSDNLLWCSAMMLLCSLSALTLVKAKKRG